MAYDYNKAKEAYQSLSKEQQQQYVDKNKNSESFQRFYKDYMNEVNGKNNTQNTTQNTGSTVSKNTVSNNRYGQPTEYQPNPNGSSNNISPYQNQGEGNYAYDEGTKYYEKQGGSQASSNTNVVNSVRDAWNAKSYEEQQELLKNNPNMQETLTKYGIINKSGPTGAKSSPYENQGEGQYYYDGEYYRKEGEKPKTGDNWDYQDNSPERMAEIIRNLDDLSKSNPGLFSDYNSFYNAFIAGKGRTQEQIDTLNDYFNKMKQYSKYDNLSSSDLGYGLAHGQPYEDYLAYLKYNDPQRYAEIQEARKAEEDKIKSDASMDTIGNMTGEIDPTKTATGKVIEWLKAQGLFVDKDGNLIDDRTENYASEEELGYQKQIADINARNLDIDNTVKHTYDDLVKKYPGATKATLMAMAQDMNADLLREKENNLVELTRLQGYVNYMQQEREDRTQIGKDSISQLQKEYGMYYDYSPEGMSELAQAKYAATNVTLDQADNGTDTQKQMALDSVLSDYYDKYGSIIQRSKSQVINDVMKLAKDKGITLSQALQENFLSQLRKKPGFNALNTVKSDPYVVKVGDVAYRYNPETDEFELIGGGTIGSATGSSGVPGTVAGSEWSNGNQVKLGEEAVDTGIKNVYGTNVKLAPTVGNMLQRAVDSLKSQGIDLQIGDSYRSYETQKRAYEEDQAKPANQRKGVAAPGKSFHEIGQAIDVAQSQMNDPAVIQALLDAGFTRPVKSEPRHWSYGEGKDQFGGVPSQNKANNNTNLDPYSGVKGYTSTGAEINNGGWISDLEDKYTKGFTDKDDRKEIYASYGITPAEFEAQKRAYGKWYADNNRQKEMQDKLSLLLEMYDWETGVDTGWGDYHSGMLDKANTADSGWGWDMLSIFPTKATQGKAIFDKYMKDETLNKFLELKENGATFGAMSDGEWKIIADSISKLKWDGSKANFKQELEYQIKDYIDAMNKKGVELPSYQTRYGGVLPDYYSDGGVDMI